MTYENGIRLNKKRKEDNKRKIKILEIIKNHKRIHNNSLKRAVHEALGTGTKTFDQLIKEMVENKTILKTRIKNQFHYSLAYDDSKHEKGLNLDIKVKTALVRITVSHLIDQYETFNLLTKTSQVLFTIKEIFRILEIISVYYAMYGNNKIVEKKEKNNRFYLKELFKKIQQDNDKKIIFGLIQNNFFPTKYADIINELPTTS